jgi:hypothetical protein
VDHSCDICGKKFSTDQYRKRHRKQCILKSGRQQVAPKTPAQVAISLKASEENPEM